MTNSWTPDSWKNFEAKQQPQYEKNDLDKIIKELSTVPPLVFAGEIRSLRKSLTEVEQGRGFVLQAGDCAESFDAFNAPSIREKLRVILQMAVVLTYSSGVPCIKIGRIAGQFAKPRSADFEKRGDEELPSYRGDIVNDIAFTQEARIPKAKRLLRGYNQSASTLNLLRAFTKGGFADLSRVNAWNQEFIASTPEVNLYNILTSEITRALTFMRACGIDLETEHQLHEVDFYTSHEALLLPYEQALTRNDSTTGDFYDCSAHLVWIGERTREIDGAHVEFMRGINNPVGIKLGPTATGDDALALIEKINPNNEEGKIIFVLRAGADKILDMAPGIMQKVKDAGKNVTWMSDPMHGNTFTHSSGFKTRDFNDVMREIKGFFESCSIAGVWPGGVHLELTGDDVTECIGGVDSIEEIESKYETRCDPRLNARQGLDLAFAVSELLTKGR